MNSSFFTIITMYQEFNMTIENKYDNYYYIKLHNASDENNPCIEIYKQKNEIIGKLQQVLYNENCNLTNNMIGGKGTIDMINATLATLAFIFKDNLTDIELDDCSYISCGENLNDKKPSLKHYYFAFKGKTWYEYNFGAIPNVKYHQIYQDTIHKFNSSNEKKDVIWFTTIINHLKNDNDTYKRLIELYKEAYTYKDFFYKLKKDDNINVCMKKYDWIEKFFISAKLDIPIYWRIPVSCFKHHSDYINILQNGLTINNNFIEKIKRLKKNSNK